MTEAKLLKEHKGWVLWGVRNDGTEFNYRYATKTEAKKAAEKMEIIIV